MKRGEKIQFFKYEFNSCFQEIHKYAATMNTFSMQFEVNVDTAPTGISNGDDSVAMRYVSEKYVSRCSTPRLL